MSDTLNIVVEIVARLSGVRREKLSASWAIDQDIRISGDDVTEIAEALANRFGEHVWQWPWQRFAELSEPSALIFPYLIWRLLSWPFRGRFFIPAHSNASNLGTSRR